LTVNTDAPPLSRGRKAPASSQRDPRRSYVSGQLRIERISLPYPPLATCFCLPSNKKGRRNAGKRRSPTAASYGCGARPFGARTPDGVPPRLSPQGIIPSQRLGSGQASWDAVRTGVTRLRLSQSREHLPPRSSCRGTDTQTAREQTANPPASTAPAPPHGMPPVGVPWRAGFCDVTQVETIVNI
jgi:hypothetical protein